METQNSDAKTSQIINWYFVQAEKGGHRDSGDAEDKSDLKTQRNMVHQYVDGSFLECRFATLSGVDMQRIIDDTAASGAEKAASWLRTIFSNVDKFAVRQGVIESVRTKRLLAPSIGKKPSALSDAMLKSMWETLSYAASGAATADRGACLAVMLSGITLQPLGSLFSMRRSEVDVKSKLWVAVNPARYVYLSAVALDLVAQAKELGDLIHRDQPAEYLLASAGPQRSPDRPLSYSSTFDTVQRLVGKKATPHDVRLTAIENLRALGGDELRSLVKTVSTGALEMPPDDIKIALLEGWSERVALLTQKALR